MLALRRVLNFMVAFALIGIVVASLVAPSWYSFSNMMGMCQCSDLARQTADKVIHLQMMGGGSGAVLGILLGIAWTVSRRPKPAAP